MTSASRRVFAVLLLPLAVLLLAGSVLRAASKEERRRRVEEAATVKDYPPRDWDEAFVYESKAYRVKTNTSEEVASYVGQLMDYAQKNYRSVFGYEEDIPELEVFAYRTYDEYMRVGNAPMGSSGFFRWSGTTSTIHVAYIDRWGRRNPTKVLLHEGTHQFVHMAINFVIPEKYRQRFPRLQRLPTIPLWLNEGIATYMEVSYYDGDELVVGEINGDRLDYLQGLLRDRREPSLKDLFAANTPEYFQLPHYATAWGYTYWFLHDRKRSFEKKKRGMLKDYIEACQKGFMEDPEKDFEQLFLQGDDWAQHFMTRWQDHIRERGFEAFVAVTTGDPDKFPKWEELWREWILDLKENDPYGGLYRKRRR